MKSRRSFRMLLVCAPLAFGAPTADADSPLVAASQGISARTAFKDQQAATQGTTISNQTIKELSKAGRIAAVGRTTEAEPDETITTDAAASGKRREYWRRQYQSRVARIRKTKNRLREAEARQDALQRQGVRPMTQAERARYETNLSDHRSQISSLEHELEDALELYHSTIRQARQEGAQPGWFRDLPQP